MNATGGSEVTAYSIDGDGVITFSATKLIFNYQSSSGGYVYDHVTTVVLPNGTVSLTATDLIAPDPNSGDPFYTESVYLPDGRRDHLLYCGGESGRDA